MNIYVRKLAPQFHDLDPCSPTSSRYMGKLLLIVNEQTMHPKIHGLCSAQHIFCIESIFKIIWFSHRSSTNLCLRRLYFYRMEVGNFDPIVCVAFLIFFFNFADSDSRAGYSDLLCTKRFQYTRKQ